MLRVRVPRLNVPAGSDGQFNGQTVTATASLTAGAMTGAAQFAGAVIVVSASLIAGAFTGAAQFGGQTTTATASISAGALSGAAQFDGQTVTATASAIPGAMTGAAQFGGQTATATATIIKGAMSGGGGGTADPAAVWAYELLPGITAGQMLIELWRMHGLDAANPLTVTATARNVESIAQSITDSSGTVTVQRT